MKNLKQLNLFFVWTMMLALCAIISLVACGRTNVYDNLVEMHGNRVRSNFDTDVVNDSGKEAYNEGYKDCWDNGGDY